MYRITGTPLKTNDAEGIKAQMLLKGNMNK